jgi:hypothetical protein
MSHGQISQIASITITFSCSREKVCFPFPNRTLDSLTGMLYPDQYNKIRAAHVKLGIQTSVKTQTGRKTGARAEELGASADSVDKQGKWATKSRDGAYANTIIAWEFARVAAGFEPERKRVWYAREQDLPGHDELEALIFPQLEQSRQQIKDANQTTEVAGKSFLDLIEYMRKVILQDVSILMEMDEFKNLALFQDEVFNVAINYHQIFQSERFKTYAKALRDRIAETPAPESVLIGQAMPLVNESLNGMRTDIRNSTTDVLQMKDLVVTLTESFMKNTDELGSQFRDLRYDLGQGLTDMGLSLTRGPGGLAAGFTSEGSTTEAVGETSTTGVTSEGSATGVTSEGSATGVTSEGSATGATSAGATSAGASSGSEPDLMPDYKMSRGVATVAEAYAEYDVGLFPHPSVKSLEEKYANRWRILNTESVFYSRRLPLYRVFEKLLVEKKWDKDAFIARLEVLRQRSGSLRKLCNVSKTVLAAAREAGTDLLVILEQRIV